MEISWVDWFLSQSFSQYFVRIDDEYLKNIENYYGLRQKVSNFYIAFKLICGSYIPEYLYPTNWPQNVNESAMILYGLLHARFLISDHGLELMYEKYQQFFFEMCPRTLCHNVMCLPYGISNDFGKATVKMFCTNCNDIYCVNNEYCYCVDGACFGDTWVHLFVQKYPDVIPNELPEKYVPRLFGYKFDGDGSINEEEEEIQEFEE
ncbi:Casein kinase II subunit beta' [Tritrichomonas foetus]|uniref:Casein kinase II subunit beta n=1 Tax=Tritrichomonas foetus TaxID=1144522 RepID=A0A1J4L272_9EUKA|nr:Casein kinase II subunit beta' [Tritrichomonas foetus]|eukprot:OHT17514.1 Casein kinase II subunit beta' [Tritrichomonas foetus]